MKMIVMDMDGTLLNSQKVISEKTQDYLIKLQEEGIKLVLASGRPLSGLLDHAYALKMDKYDGYLISFNGACLTSMRTLETIWEESIHPSDAKRILDHLEHFDVIPMVSDDTVMYVNNVFNNKIHHQDKEINIIEYESRGGGYLLSEKQHLGDFVDFNLYKILIAGDAEYLKLHHQAISEPFVDTYNAMFTAPFYYEFTHKLADKGLALKELSKVSSTSLEEMIGFGDDLNDLPFLKIVGRSVAMGNANPAILEFVDDVCLDHDSDGIYTYLKAL